MEEDLNQATADPRLVYYLLAWVSLTLTATLFARHLLNFLSGRRTLSPDPNVKRLRILSFGAFLMGIWWLWKLRR
jgi:hypothetical protein